MKPPSISEQILHHAMRYIFPSASEPGHARIGFRGSPLHHRSITIDLANTAREVIEINRKKWRVRTRPGARPLPKPKRHSNPPLQFLASRLNLPDPMRPAGTAIERPVIATVPSVDSAVGPCRGDRNNYALHCRGTNRKRTPPETHPDAPRFFSVIRNRNQRHELNPFNELPRTHQPKTSNPEPTTTNYELRTQHAPRRTILYHGLNRIQ